MLFGRLHLVVQARVEEGGAGAEERGAGSRCQPPQCVAARIAVVRDDGGVGEQGADHDVPHHPTCRGEPEEPVVRLEIQLQDSRFQQFEEHAAVAVHDRLRRSRGARAVQHPQRVIEVHGCRARPRFPGRSADRPRPGLPGRSRARRALLGCARFRGVVRPRSRYRPGALRSRSRSRPSPGSAPRRCAR